MSQWLILFASPHRGGPTASVLNACTDALTAAGEAFTLFSCFEQPIAPCNDCRYCHTHAACRQRDLDETYRALEQADRLLILTPVYNRSVPAPFKAFLDRQQRYWAARFIRGERPPIAVPKKVYLVTVGGSPRNDGDYVLAQLEPVFTIWNATLSGVWPFSGTDSAPPNDAALLKPAAALRADIDKANG